MQVLAERSPRERERLRDEQCKAWRSQSTQKPNPRQQYWDTEVDSTRFVDTFHTPIKAIKELQAVFIQLTLARVEYDLRQLKLEDARRQVEQMTKEERRRQSLMPFKRNANNAEPKLREHTAEEIKARQEGREQARSEGLRLLEAKKPTLAVFHWRRKCLICFNDCSGRRLQQIKAAFSKTELGANLTDLLQNTPFIGLLDFLRLDDKPRECGVNMSIWMEYIIDPLEAARSQWGGFARLLEDAFLQRATVRIIPERREI